MKPRCQSRRYRSPRLGGTGTSPGIALRHPGSSRLGVLLKAFRCATAGQTPIAGQLDRDPVNNVANRQGPVRGSINSPGQTRGKRRGRELQRSLASILAYNWAYIFESVIVRPLESCLAGDLRVRRFVPESRNSLVSSESHSAALAPLRATQAYSAPKYFPYASCGKWSEPRPSSPKG